MSDFYGNGDWLPKLNPDPMINAELTIQFLAGALDVARQALAAAAAMRVVEPSLQRIKDDAAWAMRDTAPSNFAEGLSDTLLQQRIQQLIAQHGGLRAAARAVGIDHAYLACLRDGTKDNPPEALLATLELRRVDCVRFVDAPADAMLAERAK